MRLLLVSALTALGFAMQQAPVTAATVTYAPVPTFVQRCRSTPSYATHTSGGTITDTVTCGVAPRQGDGLICIPAENEDKTGDLRTTVQIPNGFGLRTSAGETNVQGGLRGIPQAWEFDKIAGANEPTTYTFGWTLASVNSGSIGMAHSTQCYEFANVNTSHLVGRFAVTSVGTVPSNGALAFPFTLDANYPGGAVIGGFLVNKEVAITAGAGETLLDYGSTSGATAPLAHIDMIQTSPVRLTYDSIAPVATLASVPSGTAALAYVVTLNSQVPPATSGNFWTRKAMATGQISENLCSNAASGSINLTTSQITAVSNTGIHCFRDGSAGENTSSSTNNARLCSVVSPYDNATAHLAMQLNEFFYGQKITDAVINATLARYPSGCVDRFELSNENDYYNTGTGDVAAITPVSTPTLSLSVGTGGGLAAGTRCYVATLSTYVGQTDPSNQVCVTVSSGALVNATITPGSGFPGAASGIGARLHEGASGGPYSFINNVGCATVSNCQPAHITDDGSPSPDATQQITASATNNSGDFAGMYTRNGADWLALASSKGFPAPYASSLTHSTSSYTLLTSSSQGFTPNNHPYTYRRSPMRYDTPGAAHINCGLGSQFAFDPCADQLYVAPGTNGKVITEVGSNTLNTNSGVGACVANTNVSSSCGTGPNSGSGYTHPYVQGAYIGQEIMVNFGLRRYNRIAFYSFWDAGAATNEANNYGQFLCADVLTRKPAGNFAASFLNIISDTNLSGATDTLGYRFETTDGSAIPPRFASVLLQNPTTRVMYLMAVNAVTLQDPNYGNLTFPTAVPMKLTLQNAPQPSYATRDAWQYSSGLPYIQAATWNTAASDNSTVFSLTGDITMWELAPPSGTVQPAQSSFSVPNSLPGATSACP